MAEDGGALPALSIDIGEIETFVSDVAVTLVATVTIFAGTVFAALLWAITAIVYETVVLVAVVLPGDTELLLSGGNSCLLTEFFSTAEVAATTLVETEETLSVADAVHMGTEGRGTFAGTFPLMTTPVQAF